MSGYTGYLQIVNVTVTQTIAPAPNTLQQTGAIISQGGTTLAAGSEALLTQQADFTAIVSGGVALSALLLTGGTVTATTAVAHGFPIGDTLTLVLTGNTPTAYNGTFTCTITTTTAFTFPLSGSPGSATAFGIATDSDVAELTAAVTTFFAQSGNVSVYVLELGAGTPAQGVTALSTYLTANPGTIYAILVPKEWDGVTSFLALIASYEATTSKLYFFVTTTLGTYSSYTAVMKCVVALIQAPAAPSTEFTLASFFQVVLGTSPSSNTQVSPFGFRYVTGVTAYPTKGNSALFVMLKAAGINIIGTGSEGGVSNTLIMWGTTMDGRQFNYWYSVDWVQIHLNVDISNAIINGSNNTQNPLFYNQQGITTLQGVAQATMNRAVTYGLALGPITVAAVPFQTYVQQNPSDYPNGIYSGLSVSYSPQIGFERINFNVNVTDFPAA